MPQYSLANFISRLHVASCKLIYTTSIFYSLINLRFLIFFNNEGFIEGFRVIDNYIILVYLKFNHLNNLFLLKFTKLISTPGHRQY